MLEVCLGFDGSEVSDWTVIRAETLDGFQFTPRYGPDGRPTIWDPAQWGGTIPRGEVHAAVAELFDTCRVSRFYCDPKDWRTEIESWALAHGEEHVFLWKTERVVQMHESLKRFVTDLTTGVLTHDGCPVTATHVGNARKAAKPGDRYILSKPHGASHQKIDAAMAAVLAHEAACDARADGWGQKRKAYVFSA